MQISREHMPTSILDSLYTSQKSYSNGHDLAIKTGDCKVNLIHIQFLCKLFALC